MAANKRVLILGAMAAVSVAVSAGVFFVQGGGNPFAPKKPTHKTPAMDVGALDRMEKEAVAYTPPAISVPPAQAGAAVATENVEALAQGQLGPDPSDSATQAAPASAPTAQTQPVMNAQVDQAKVAETAKSTKVSRPKPTDTGPRVVKGWSVRMITDDMALVDNGKEVVKVWSGAQLGKITVIRLHPEQGFIETSAGRIVTTG